MLNVLSLALEIIGLCLLVIGYGKSSRNILLTGAAVLWLGAALGDMVHGFHAGFRLVSPRWAHAEVSVKSCINLNIPSIVEAKGFQMVRKSIRPMMLILNILIAIFLYKLITGICMFGFSVYGFKRAFQFLTLIGIWSILTIVELMISKRKNSTSKF